MSEKTGIEWCDSTHNNWIGCTPVSAACANCYAEQFGRRMGVRWGSGEARLRTGEATRKQPLLWDRRADRFRACAGCGLRGELGAVCPRCGGTEFLPARRRVFASSLSDVFDNEIPVSWRYDLFRLIAQTPRLDWLLLTKRIGNADAMMMDARPDMSEYPDGIEWPPKNVWIGATICNQEEADRDILKLLSVPAAKRFLSIEPMLGPIDLRNVAIPVEHDMLRRPWDIDSHKFNVLQEYDDDHYHQTPSTIDWVICGGESGKNARPMHLDWVRNLRDQCVAAGVPFFFKQWGEWVQVERSSEISSRITMPGQNGEWFAWPGGRRDGWRTGPIMHRVGKKEAGRLLDGREWNGMPV